MTPLHIGRHLGHLGDPLELDDLDDKAYAYPVGLLSDPEKEVLVRLGVLILVIDEHGIVVGDSAICVGHWNPLELSEIAVIEGDEVGRVSPRAALLPGLGGQAVGLGRSLGPGLPGHLVPEHGEDLGVADLGTPQT